MNENRGIPNGWAWTKLGEVCKLKNGYAFKSSDYSKEGIPVIRISDINEGVVSVDESVKVIANQEYENYIISKDEILVAMSGATTGKFGIFKNNIIAYQNQRVGKFQILDKNVLNNTYLLFLLYSLKSKILEDAYGGAQPNISSGKIEELEIPLPPLLGQQRIIAKIEELFSSLDKGIESLKTAQQQLKVYRQAVLKWAFEGKLTNKVLVEGELPSGWALVKLGNLVVDPKRDLVDGPFGSNLKADEYTDSGVPVFKIQNIKVNRFVDKKINYITEEKAKSLSRHSFVSGDLIITKLGDPLGLCCKVPENYRYGIIVADLMRLRPNNLVVYDQFLIYAINCNVVQNQFKAITKGTTRPRVNLTIVRDIQIPLPPLPEQHRIVQEIESRLSVCDKIVQPWGRSCRACLEVLKTNNRVASIKKLAMIFLAKPSAS
jgi:type I restriction enzyme S subunit